MLYTKTKALNFTMIGLNVKSPSMLTQTVCSIICKHIVKTMYSCHGERIVLECVQYNDVVFFSFFSHLFFPHVIQSHSLYNCIVSTVCIADVNQSALDDS